ncbi:uncharacterized protein LOC128673997 isoform X2 [Plodia interpunctella]|nr:uncharacterized protein LOC128673997 isoform X2 [Plodia interpunctella]XP_053608178.1 uncharacterized protein LOC128673997 isoform X2 [Plodia interpunctella]
MSAKQATLVFPTPYDAKNAVEASNKVSIYGTLLTVKAFDPNPMADHISKKEKKQQLSGITNPKEISLAGDFTQQLDSILGKVRLSQEEVTAISTLYADVERVLQPLWPGSTAVPFGSIPTGLGIRSSDADCFVLVPPRQRHPAANHVMRAKRVLQSSPATFADVVAIPRANTPIVKFLHVPTKTACDLTFKTELGTKNSRLVAFLLHTDPRILPMAVVIKYWARVHDMSGSGKLTNYALTMLLIFYLQQPPVAILPSVQWLQSNVREEIVDHWNVAFDARRESLPPINNRASISELFGGFFQYYSLFNFDDLIVCPYLGYPVRKELFKDLNSLPQAFERYRNNIINDLVMPMRFNTSICVQDPFEQCHNVASTINSKLAEDIKAYFKFAANAYEQEAPKKCKGFFAKILLEKPKLPRRMNSPEFRVNLFPNMIANIDAPDWRVVVRKIVFEIFESMLLIQLGKVEEKVNPDSKKEKEKYLGLVPKAIWKRKQFTRLYSMSNMSLVERNKRITEEILNTEKGLVNISFQMTITFCHQPRSSLVSIKMSSGDVDAYREFGKFFVSVLQNWFLQLVKPYANCPDVDSATKVAQTIKILDSALNTSSEDSVESETAATSSVAPP